MTMSFIRRLWNMLPKLKKGSGDPDPLTVGINSEKNLPTRMSPAKYIYLYACKSNLVGATQEIIRLMTFCPRYKFFNPVLVQQHIDGFVEMTVIGELNG